MENKTNQLEYKDTDKKSLVFKVNREELSSSKNTLVKLKNAIMSAKSIDYPNRSGLYDIYSDIIDDGHLAAVIKHRKSRVTGLQWTIAKVNGKPDEAGTYLFKQKWFKNFIDYILDSIFWGNSLVEITNNNGNVEATLIPRSNVIPEFKQIKINPYDTYGTIDYSAPIYSNTLIDANNDYNVRSLGELLSVVKLILFKEEALLNWSQYVELFGQPLRVATTDTDDPIEQNQIFAFLKDLGRSGYMVKDSNTQVEFIDNSSKSSSSALYESFISIVNNEVSKKILGGTMLTDNGSSQSQSEVHERGSLLFTKSDIVYVEHIINSALIPILQNLGILKTKSLEFYFDEPEILTIDEKIKIDQFLLDNFTVKDISYFENRYGVNLEYKENKEDNTIVNE